MNGKPRCPRRKTGLSPRRPLHGRPGIISAVELYDFQASAGSKPYL